MGSRGPRSVNSDRVVDGPESWIKLLSSSVMLFVSAPFIAVFTMLYEESFKGIESGQATWIFCIYLSIWSFSGLLAGVLSQLTTHAFTVGSGILIMGSGMIMSAFATSFIDLILSISLVIGIGQGLANTACVLVISLVFKERLGAAMGILFTVMGLSGIVTPLITAQILQHFSSKTCILSFGIYILLALAFVPLYKLRLRSREPQESSDQMEAKTLSSETKDTNIENAESREKPNLLNVINWSLLKDPTFWTLMIGIAFSLSASLSFYVLLPVVAKEQGIENETTAKFLATLAGVDMLARFFFGWLGDWNVIKEQIERPRKVIFASSGIGLGLTIAALPFGKTFSHFMVICVCFGFFVAAQYTTAYLVYTESYMSDIHSAIGLSGVTRSLMALAYGPLIEKLRNDAGDYSTYLWTSGLVTVSLFIIWLLDEARLRFF